MSHTDDVVKRIMGGCARQIGIKKEDAGLFSEIPGLQDKAQTLLDKIHNGPKPRILMLAAGRRLGIVERFQQYFDVYSYEVGIQVPIASVGATIIDGMKWKQPELLTHLEQVCNEYAIDVILPLHDQSYEAVSLLRNVYGNYKASTKTPLICGSSPLTYRTCTDKRAFATFMKGFMSSYYPSPMVNEKAIKKPAHGFGSRGIEYVDKYVDRYEDGASYVYQKHIQGTEYSVDAYFNRKGRFVGAYSRTRDRVGDGEVVESTIKLDPQLIELTKQIGEELGIVGPANFQFIRDEVTRLYGKSMACNHPYLIEVNPRLGGGSVLSMEAGLNIPEYVFYEYIHNAQAVHIINSHPEDSNGLKLIRAYKDVFFRTNKPEVADSEQATTLL